MTDENVVELCGEAHEHADRLTKARSAMPEVEKLNALAELLKIFGEATRIRILYALTETEMCVCELAEVLEMTQSAISHQLRILKQAKLVRSRRTGKTVFYALADAHVRSILCAGMEHVEE